MATDGIETKPNSIFLRIAERVYKGIFHQQMSPEVRTFLGNLSYVALGTGVATVLSFAFTVIGGRVLGPEEYGKFALIQSAADFLSIPMLLGFGVAIIKFASEKSETERNSVIIGTSLALILASSSVSALLCVAFSRALAPLFSVSVQLFYFSIVAALFQVFYTGATSLQRGLRNMKGYALLQPVYGIVLLGSFFVMVKLGQASFRTMLLPWIMAAGTTASLVFLVSRRHLRLRFSSSWAKEVLPYAMFSVVAGLSSALYTNVGKVLVGKYMTITDVGIFSAYYSPSLNVATLIFITFNVVFFPTVSRYPNKKAVFAGIDRMLPLVVGVGTPLVFAFEFAVLRLYGKDYPTDLLLMLIFALTAVLIVCYGIYSSTFNSQGLKGVRITTFSVGVIAVSDIGLSVLLIPRLGLYAATGSLSLAFAAGIICLRLLKNRLI